MPGGPRRQRPVHRLLHRVLFAGSVLWRASSPGWKRSGMPGAFTDPLGFVAIQQSQHSIPDGLSAFPEPGIGAVKRFDAGCAPGFEGLLLTSSTRSAPDSGNRSRGQPSGGVLGSPSSCYVSGRAGTIEEPSKRNRESRMDARWGRSG